MSKPRIGTVPYVAQNPDRIHVAKWQDYLPQTWDAWRGEELLGEFITHAEAIDCAIREARKDVF